MLRMIETMDLVGYVGKIKMLWSCFEVEVLILVSFMDDAVILERCN